MLGLSKRENQVSSSKPNARSGRVSASRISRSRSPFSLVLRIGALDPSLGPLPAHSQPRKRSSDGLPAHSPFGKPLLEAHLCGVLEGPKVAPSAEFPRRVVEQLPQRRARALLVEGGVDLSGTRGDRLESIQPALVEVVDGQAHRLLSAAQVFGNLRCDLAASTG